MTSNIIKERRLINLNSANSSTKFNDTFNSNVNFVFPYILKQSDDIEYVEGGILNATIPMSSYCINYTNNVLYYSVLSTVYSIICPVGNYNFTSFAQAIVSAFLLNGHTVSLVINKVNGIITITSVNIDYWQELNSTMWRILGFFQGSGNITPILNTTTPPHPLNLLGPIKLKIFCDSFSVSSYDSTNYSTNNLIDTININTASYNLLSFENITGEYGLLKKKDINIIDIQIKDENDNYINFNNIDWSITLALIIYRREQTTLKQLRLEEELEKQQPEQQQEQQPEQQQEQQPQEEQQPEQQQYNDILGVDDLDLLMYQNPNLY